MPNRLSNHCISKIVLDIRNQQWAGLEVRDLDEKASALMTTKSHIIDKRSTTDWTFMNMRKHTQSETHSENDAGAVVTSPTRCHFDKNI